MHFIFYEDLKKVPIFIWKLFQFKHDNKIKDKILQDLKGEMQKVASFLNKPLSDEKLVQLEEHLGFEAFSKNKSVNLECGGEMGIFNNVPDGRFVRKGNLLFYKLERNSNLQKCIISSIQEKREIGRSISVRNWTGASMSG